MSVNLEELTKIYESRLISCWEHTPIVLAEGKGCIVKDVEGKEYIDCTAQAWTLSVGHSHPRVISAVKEQIDKLATAFLVIKTFLCFC